MERMIAVSDHFPDVTADVEGVERAYPLGLRLTYDFDPKLGQMAIAIGLLPPVTPDDREADEEARWKNVFFLTKESTIVQVMVTALSTSATLLTEAKLPGELRFAVQLELEAMAKSMEPFVQDCFLGRTCEPSEAVTEPTAQAGDTQPITPLARIAQEPTLTPEPEEVHPPEPVAQTAPEAPALPAPNNVLVVVKRDVSPAFKRERGACKLKYTLFSEKHALRALIEGDITDVGGHTQHKHAEFVRRDVESILRDLRSDNTAYEIASFFGDTTSQTVHRISCVLQTGFGGGTELEMRRNSKAFSLPPTPIPVVPADNQETIALSPVDAAQPQFVEIFNNGHYIKVPA